MDVVTPLMQTLQAQANIDHTRATAQDTQALAQQRMLGVLLNTQAAQRATEARELLKNQQFDNPTAPGMAGPTGMPGSPGSNVFANYDYDSPLIQSARSAQQGVSTNRTLMQIAQKTGDLEMYQKAARDADNQQKEFRLAMMDVTKDDERRNREAAQAFGQAKTPDDVRNSLQYVADNLGASKAKAIEQQLAQALPGGIDNATEDQITGALAPVLNKITARGNILRFTSAAQASADRVDSRKQQAEQFADREARLAQTRAGVPNAPGTGLTPGGEAIVAEMTRKGWTMPGGARNAATVGIPAINRIAADFEAEGLPPSAITKERLDIGGQKAVVRDFSAGPTARNITSINTSLGHLQTLGDLGKALDSGDIQVVNKVVNSIANQLGKPELNNAQTAAQAVGEEMMRTFRVVGASVTEAEKWEKKFNQAMQSPEQMEGVIKTGADLLRSRLEAVDDQWRRGMGTKTGFPDIISPKNQDFLNSLGINFTVTRPSDSKASSVADKGAAPNMNAEAKPLTPDQIRTVAKMKGVAPVMGNDDFRALPKGASFIGPDGLIRTKP